MQVVGADRRAKIMAIIHRNSSVRKKTLEDFEYRLIAIFEGHFVNIFDLDAYQFGKSSFVFPYRSVFPVQSLIIPSPLNTRLASSKDRPLKGAAVQVPGRLRRAFSK